MYICKSELTNPYCEAVNQQHGIERYMGCKLTLEYNLGMANKYIRKLDWLVRFRLKLVYLVTVSFFPLMNIEASGLSWSFPG